MEGVQLGGPYLPPAFNRLRVQFPGNHGGVNWGGMSYSPELGYLFVNTNELGQLSGMMPRPGGGDGTGRREGAGQPRSIRAARTKASPAAGASASASANDPQQLPCQQPPWGQLSADGHEDRALRLARAARRHRQPAGGRCRRRGARATAAPSSRAAGWSSSARPTTRASAPSTRSTGKELWTFKLPAAAQATPITYRGRTAGSTSSSRRRAAASSAIR